ncbi:hypothetical protein ACEN2J_06060 [Pseudorhodobacter sp. W20_MBD10_FR17]|uniref:hypothetical protein n=1 Tax=Pseudorhodobacter sp. W20_MBD10_FR17 TaxID=3240266 RepID=UPI003F978B27
MNYIWLLRAARWARNPPSSARVKLVLGVILACLILVGVEHFWGWPDFLTVNRTPHRGMLR